MEDFQKHKENLRNLEGEAATKFDRDLDLAEKFYQKENARLRKELKTLEKEHTRKNEDKAENKKKLDRITSEIDSHKAKAAKKPPQ